MKENKINIKITTNIDKLIATVLTKFLSFYEIKTSEEELQKLIDEITNDENIKSALSNLVNIEN